MDRKEYLDTMEQQIRSRQAGRAARREMEGHIEEQKVALQTAGMTAEEAETGLAAGGSGPGAGSAVPVPGSLAPEGGISPAGTLVPGDGSLHLVQPVAFLRKAEDAQVPGNPVDPVAGAPDRRGPVGGG